MIDFFIGSDTSDFSPRIQGFEILIKRNLHARLIIFECIKVTLSEVLVKIIAIDLLLLTLRTTK